MIICLHKNEQGSVALEYVLTLSVAVVFLCVWYLVFEPGNGFTPDVGKPFVAYFQRILCGIALPVP